MLITRASFDKEWAQQPEAGSLSTSLLKQLDRRLDDDELLEQVRADLARRYRLTTLHGRHSTPVEVILCLLVLKDLFNWSFQQTETQVSNSTELRWFCRVGDQRVPDDTTIMRWAHLIRPETMQDVTKRVIELFTSSKKSRKTPKKRDTPDNGRKKQRNRRQEDAR